MDDYQDGDAPEIYSEGKQELNKEYIG